MSLSSFKVSFGIASLVYVWTLGIRSAFAGEEVAGNTAQQSMLSSAVPLVAIMVIFYFLLIRPQQKKMKEQKNMMAGLRHGDKVITLSGIYGDIAKNDGENVMLEVSPNVVIKIRKDAISSVLQDANKSTDPSLSGPLGKKSPKAKNKRRFYQIQRNHTADGLRRTDSTNKSAGSNET